MREYSGFFTRTTANLIDFAILLPIGLALLNLEKQSLNGMILGVMSFLILKESYFIGAHWIFGQTIGKNLMGIKIANCHSLKPLGLSQSIQRSFGDFLFSLLRIIGLYIACREFSKVPFSPSDWLYILPRFRNLDSSTAIIWISGVIYFFSESVSLLFNKANRSIQDYMAGSVVSQISPPKQTRCLIALGILFGVNLAAARITWDSRSKGDHQSMLAGNQLDFELMAFWKNLKLIDDQDQVIFYFSSRSSHTDGQQIILTTKHIIRKNINDYIRIPLEQIKSLSYKYDFGGQIDLVIKLPNLKIVLKCVPKFYGQQMAKAIKIAKAKRFPLAKTKSLANWHRPNLNRQITF